MFFKYHCFCASGPDCLVTRRMLTSVCFIIKHGPTVRQVSEIATANVSAGTVCATAETCHAFVLLLFLYSKLNRLTAATSCQGTHVKHSAYHAIGPVRGWESQRLEGGEKWPFPLNVVFTLKGTDEFLNYSQFWKLIIVSNGGSSRVERLGLGFFVKMPDSEDHQRIRFTKLSLGIWVFKVCGSEGRFFQRIKKENIFILLV